MAGRAKESARPTKQQLSTVATHARTLVAAATASSRLLRVSASKCQPLADGGITEFSMHIHNRGQSARADCDCGCACPANFLMQLAGGEVAHGALERSACVTLLLRSSEQDARADSSHDRDANTYAAILRRIVPKYSAIGHPNRIEFSW